MANNCSNFLRITTTVNPKEFVSGFGNPLLPERLEGFNASDLFAEKEVEDTRESAGEGYRIGIYSLDDEIHIEPPLGRTWYVEANFHTRWGPNVSFLERLSDFLKSKDPESAVVCDYFEPGCQVGGCWTDDGSEDDDGWPVCEYSNYFDKYVFPNGQSAPDWFDRFADWCEVSDYESDIEFVTDQTLEEYDEDKKTILLLKS